MEELMLKFDCRGGGERPMPLAPWEIGEHNDELEKREREEEYENERDDDLIQSLNLLKNNTMSPLVVMHFPEPTSKQYTANTTNAIAKPHQNQQTSLFSFPPHSKQPSQTD
jgi:hypothetical protein